MIKVVITQIISQILEIFRFRSLPKQGLL